MAHVVDDEVRAAAFLYLDAQRETYGDRIPWRKLQSFEHRGARRALITQRGIRWLSGMPALTVTTTYSPDPTAPRTPTGSARTASRATSTRAPTQPAPTTRR